MKGDILHYEYLYLWYFPSSAHDFVHFFWKLLHKLNITTFIITATQDNRQASLSTKIFYWKLFSWIPCATAACWSIWMVISKKNIHMAVSYRWTDQRPPLGPPVEWHIERKVKPNTHLSDTQPDSWKWTSYLLICFLSTPVCLSVLLSVSVAITHLPFIYHWKRLCLYLFVSHFPVTQQWSLLLSCSKWLDGVWISASWWNLGPELQAYKNEALPSMFSLGSLVFFFTLLVPSESEGKAFNLPVDLQPSAMVMSFG